MFYFQKMNKSVQLMIIWSPSYWIHLSCFPDACFYQGLWYHHGQMLNDDNCEPCYCMPNKILFGKVKCDNVKQLTCAKPIKEPGQCCPCCPEDKNLFPGRISQKWCIFSYLWIFFLFHLLTRLSDRNLNLTYGLSVVALLSSRGF